MAIPRPNHQIDVSFYFDDCDRYPETRVVPSEVAGFSNTHYCWASRYFEGSATPWSKGLKGLRAGCQRAYEAGRQIMPNLNLQEKTPGAATPLMAMLEMLSDFWTKIPRIEMADEPRWTKVVEFASNSTAIYRSGLLRTTILPTALVRKPSTAATTAKVRAAIRSLGLPPRDLGVVYSTVQFPGAPIDTLDWVGIEVYVDELPGHAVSAVNVREVSEYTREAINAVPMTKDIGLVPQAYTRNYALLDIGNLKKGSPAYRNAIQCAVDIMAVPYSFAKDNKRIVCVNFFSWKRASGSAEYKRLTSQAKALGTALCAGR